MGSPARGSIIISVDAELGWGFHDLPSPPVDRLARARTNWKTVQDLCVEYDIPLTWAIVGHLMLTECDGVHSDHPRSPEWFARERGEWQDRLDLRFAPELVEELVESDVEHDIGCHTFSHVCFDETETERAVVEAELTKAQSAANRFGLSLDSFVFPRNVVGYREILADHGFTSYRPRRLETDQLRRRLQKIQAFVNPATIDLVEPTLDEYGLASIPPSLFLYGFQGRLRRVLDSIWTDPIVRQVTHGIDRAIAENGIFHVWFHPSDIVNSHDVDRLNAIFTHIDRRRSAGLTVETMSDVADRISLRAG